MDIRQVIEIITMIEEQDFDARTIAMGTSLLNCADLDINRIVDRIYKKIVEKAGSLVAVGDEITAELGIPIVNKRVSVIPIFIIGVATDVIDYLPLVHASDKAADEVGINFIGDFSALVQRGCQKGDGILINSIPHAPAETSKVCSSVNIGSAKSGINMTAVADMGRITKETAELPDLDAAKLVVFANAVEDNSFMAGAFHGVGEADVVTNVGVSGPDAVKRAFGKVRSENFNAAVETIKKTAFRITCIGQLVGQMASERLRVKFGTADFSLAPTPAVGDSMVRVLEEIGLEIAGTHGTTVALVLLNDQVKKGGIMACNQAGGLPGAFIPASEDEGMIAAVQNGSLNLEKLEAMTAICSVGLDMIAIPEDTPYETIAAMATDEAATGVINQKTIAVRVIPKGREGDITEFGGLLGTALVMSVNHNSSVDFIKRGSQIPVPAHNFKN